MGVYRLYSCVRSKQDEASTEINLDGSTKLYVDANGLLHEILERCLDKTAQEAPFFAQYLSYQTFYDRSIEYLAPFRRAGVKLIFVFDNNIGADDARFKDQTGEERRNDALKELVAIQESLLGNEPLGDRFKKVKPLKLPMLASQLRAAIRASGFEIRQSFHEADASMAHMLLHDDHARYTTVAILAKDSDFFVFRDCRCVPFETVKVAGSAGIKARLYTSDDVAKSLGLTWSQLVDAALLLGCDYTKAVNLSADVAAKLEVDTNDPEVVAAWIKSFARDGLRRHRTLINLFRRNRDLEDAWSYSYKLYRLEETPLTPTDLTADADEVTRRIAIGVECDRFSSSYLKYRLQKRWRGGLEFEMVYPEGEGRLGVSHMLRPLRRRLYGLLGLGRIEEMSRSGTAFVVEHVDALECAEDKDTLFVCLDDARDVSDDAKLSALDWFCFQAFELSPPSEDADQLAALGERKPGLYLAVLALRVVAMSSWWWCSEDGVGGDPCHRLTVEEFDALAATIALRGNDQLRVDMDARKSSSLPTPTGKAVMDSASLASWFMSSVAFLKGVLSLFRGPKDVLDLEPRRVFDFWTYHAVRTGAVRPPREAQALREAALGPLWSLGFTTRDVFAQATQNGGGAGVDDLAQAMGKMTISGGIRVRTLGDDDGADDDDAVDLRRFDAGSDEEEHDDDVVLQPRKPVAQLPIHPYRSEIVRTIRENRVTLIEGETGSGKSTQVPQYIVKDNPDTYTKVIVTQPTRLAATAAARRVAHEMGCQLGDEVGYRIGGEGETSSSTRIIFATAGWLLAFLSRPEVKESTEPYFTHIIIDEVHERSMDSDLLCLVTKLLLLQSWTDGRFSIVLMSATMQGGIFEDYFGRDLGTIIPRLFVGVRRHPVQEVYLEDLKTTYPQLVKGKLNVAMAIDTLLRKYSKVGGGRPGAHGSGGIRMRPEISNDVMVLATHLIRLITRQGETTLVFVAGMADIDSLFSMLEKSAESAAAAREGESTKLEVLICHSLISLEDQAKALESNKEMGRVILATNMAESSITFPDVTYVIDFGICKRISYDQREHRTVLQPCWISQASMKQRSGRTGRVCPGTTLRLYTRELAELAEPYDPPEIVTQPLEQVVLRLKIMNFDDVRETLAQCVQPPELGQVDNAVRGLFTMGALESSDEHSQVTPMGHLMSSLGLDLQVARMVVLGVAIGCVVESLVLGAVLSVQDPFVLPHAAVSEDASDYLEMVKRVQTARDAYSRGLGSDPLCLLFVYMAWLRETPDTRRAWAHNNGLVMTRMKNLDGCLRTLTHGVSSNSAFVPSYAELVEMLRDPEFEQSVMQPDRLLLLRALLAGAFHDKLLTGKSRMKGTFTEHVSRMLRIGQMPEVLSSQELVEEALAMGSVESMRMKDGAIEVVFARPASTRVNQSTKQKMKDKKGGEAAEDTMGGGGYDFQTNGVGATDAVLLADAEPLGRFTDLSSSVKALLNAKDYKGEITVTRPVVSVGMPGYVPAGAAGSDADNPRQCIIKNVGTPAGAFAVKAVQTGQPMQLNKSSVLKCAVIPRKDRDAPLFFTTSEIQKIVSKEGSVSFRVGKCTFLPYSEAILALLAAAFVTDQPVYFLRRNDDEEEEDEWFVTSDNDSDGYCGIVVGGYLGTLLPLPRDTPSLLNRFRRLVSRCVAVASKGGLRSSQTAADILLQLRDLTAKQQGNGGRTKRDRQGVEELRYEVLAVSTSDALPRLGRADGGEEEDDEDEDEDDEVVLQPIGSRSFGNRRHGGGGGKYGGERVRAVIGGNPSKAGPSAGDSNPQLQELLDSIGAASGRGGASVSELMRHKAALLAALGVKPKKDDFRRFLRKHNVILDGNRAFLPDTDTARAPSPPLNGGSQTGISAGSTPQQRGLLDAMVNVVKRAEAGFLLRRLQTFVDRKTGNTFEGDLVVALQQRGLRVEGGMVYNDGDSAPQDPIVQRVAELMRGMRDGVSLKSLKNLLFQRTRVKAPKDLVEILEAHGYVYVHDVTSGSKKVYSPQSPPPANVTQPVQGQQLQQADDEELRDEQAVGASSPDHHWDPRNQPRPGAHTERDSGYVEDSSRVDEEVIRYVRNYLQTCQDGVRLHRLHAACKKRFGAKAVPHYRKLWALVESLGYVTAADVGDSRRVYRAPIGADDADAGSLADGGERTLNGRKEEQGSRSAVLAAADPDLVEQIHMFIRKAPDGIRVSRMRKSLKSHKVAPKTLTDIVEALGYVAEVVNGEIRFYAPADAAEVRVDRVEPVGSGSVSVRAAPPSAGHGPEFAFVCHELKRQKKGVSIKFLWTKLLREHPWRRKTHVHDIDALETFLNAHGATVAQDSGRVTLPRGITLPPLPKGGLDLPVVGAVVEILWDKTGGLPLNELLESLTSTHPRWREEADVHSPKDLAAFLQSPPASFFIELVPKKSTRQRALYRRDF